MTRTSAATPIVVITFGHSSSMVHVALQPALELAAAGYRVDPVIVDDCSGAAPTVRGARTICTPANRGYSAAVNFANESLPGIEGRIIFINPDAIVPKETLLALLEPPVEAEVVVPTIMDGTRLENVRRVLTVREVLWALIAGRLGRQPQYRAAEAEADGEYLLSGWTAAGTVVSFSREFLTAAPLRPEMFWVEMSAMARDNPNAGMYRLSVRARHDGHSTQKTAPVVVSASRAAAQVNYVRVYGTRLERLALPLFFYAGLGLRLVSRRMGRVEARRFIGIYRGEVTWQQIRLR